MHIESFTLNKEMTDWADHLHLAWPGFLRRSRWVRNGALFGGALAFVLFGISGFLHIAGVGDLHLPVMLNHVHTATAALAGGLPSFGAWGVVAALAAMMIGMGMAVASQNPLPAVMGIAFAGWLYVAPDLLSGALPKPAEHHPSAVEASYTDAQRMVLRKKALPPADRVRFLADVRTMYARHANIKTNPRVVYVLDHLAYGHAVAPLAVHYAQERIQDARTDFAWSWDVAVGADAATALAGLSGAGFFTLWRNRRRTEALFPFAWIRS
ncbi:hypothetical protein JKG47_12345 [Acidithiobacillus sp. MC6.1]|nr:hypothetical protein [Acidithiobacillus sp. MC6.1]